MKTLVAVAIALALVASGPVAEAYVAVVGTAISVPSAPDAERSARLEEAIWAAIRDVLEHAVAFTPTVVTIEDARIVGDRLYLSIFLSLRGASAGHRSVLPRGGGVVRLHGRWSVEDAHVGQLYYVYADPAICKCVYVGTPAQYQRVLEKRLANEQLVAQQELLNEDAVIWALWAPWPGF